MKISNILAGMLASAATIAPGGQSAFAAEPGEASQIPASGEASEIIVTAQKKSERAIDVPISIAAATGEQLTNAGVTSVVDLGKVALGFNYQPGNYGEPALFIRGMGFFNNTLASTPAVTVYVDQVPLTFPATMIGAALDLERVEVLKGPQGTLFGENSTGGAVNFIAAKPTQEFSAGGYAEYARFGQVNLGGYVSGSLSQTLGARLAVSTEQGGAWQKSLTRPGDRLGDRNFTNGRLTLDWQPSDAAHFSFTASGWVNQNDPQAAQYKQFAQNSLTFPEPTRSLLLAQPIAPRTVRDADWDPDVRLRQDSQFFQLALRGDFELADATDLTTITAYTDLDEYVPYDPDGTAINNIRINTSGRVKGFFQEVRLSGEMGRMKWMFGGNYSHNITKETKNVHVFYATFSGGLYDAENNINNVDFNTVSIFGSAEHELGDFVLSGSARYTDQTQRATGGTCDTGSGQWAAFLSPLSTIPFGPGDCTTFISPDLTNPANLAPPYTPVGGLMKRKLSEDNVSWRANLSWKPNRNTHVYANVTRGYKSGAFSVLPAYFDTQYQPVPQESVLQYEAGFKVSLPEHQLRLSGALFYSDYTNKQLVANILTPFGNLPGLISVPKSRVLGGEFEFVWQPVRGLTLTGGATYVDAKVKSSMIVTDPFSIAIDVAGRRFPVTPRLQASFGFDYGFALSNSMNGFVGGSVTHSSKTPLTFSDNPFLQAPAHALVDLRAGVELDGGRWRAEVWGRNIFNKYYLTNASRIVDTVAVTTGGPATYGVRVSTKF